jgi:hypothetical protein
MKQLTMLLLIGFVSTIGYAGGSLGGGGAGIKEELSLSLMEAAFNVEALPKTYIGGEDFRRIRARLSVDGTDSVPAIIGDETLQLRKLKSSIVDTKISKELLPSENVSLEGGTVGGFPGIN